jgi:hypothetical protein
MCIVVQTDMAGPMKGKWKRKYEGNYIKYVFTSVIINGDKGPVRNIL